MVLAQRIYSTLITEEAPPFDVAVSVWIRCVDAGAKKEYDIGFLQDKRAFQMRMISVLKHQYHCGPTRSTTTRTEKNLEGHTTHCMDSFLQPNKKTKLELVQPIVMKTLCSKFLSKVVQWQG